MEKQKMKNVYMLIAPGESYGLTTSRVRGRTLEQLCKGCLNTASVELSSVDGPELGQAEFTLHHEKGCPVFEVIESMMSKQPAHKTKKLLAEAIAHVAKVASADNN